MSYNQFDYYRQLRDYQLHLNKISNPQILVPKHQAFKPKRVSPQKNKQFKRNLKIQEIQRQNYHILNKLIKIGKRQLQYSKSSPSLKLPSLKKQFIVPLYQQQNNRIAKKIIESKPHINNSVSIQGYKSVQARKRSLSKFVNQNGVLINRKKYIAQLMLLKKMRTSRLLQNI